LVDGASIFPLGCQGGGKNPDAAVLEEITRLFPGCEEGKRRGGIPHAKTTKRKGCLLHLVERVPFLAAGERKKKKERDLCFKKPPGEKGRKVFLHFFDAKEKAGSAAGHRQGKKRRGGGGGKKGIVLFPRGVVQRKKGGHHGGPGAKHSVKGEEGEDERFQSVA